MSTQLTTVEPTESVDHCLRFMSEKRVRHLPVVKDNQINGVISIGDLVKHVISAQSATIDQLERYRSADEARRCAESGEDAGVGVVGPLQRKDADDEQNRWSEQTTAREPDGPNSLR